MHFIYYFLFLVGSIFMTAGSKNCELNKAYGAKSALVRGALPLSGPNDPKRDNSQQRKENNFQNNATSGFQN